MIHLLFTHLGFLCVIALLSGRSGLIYRELFVILAQHAQRFNLTFRPAMITSDFEPALLKTIADEVGFKSCLSFTSHSVSQMPNARHIGCHFHFVQAIYRQVQQLQLTMAYREDEMVRSNVRKLMAMALLPIENVEEAFEHIKKQASNAIQSLMDYFNRYWMTRVKWNLWNVGDLELRTNNAVEGKLVLICLTFCIDKLQYLGWNHRFNRLVAKHHPNVWHLFDCLKKEEVSVRQQLLKMVTGVKKNKPKKQVLLDDRISYLRLQFKRGELNLENLLDGLSLLIASNQ